MAKSITIAFPRGGILPASITRAEPEDVGPHVPVKVPEAYGLQLIADRFAVQAEEVVVKSKKESSVNDRPNLAALGKAIGIAKKALNEATDETRAEMQSLYDAALMALGNAKAGK